MLLYDHLIIRVIISNTVKLQKSGEQQRYKLTINNEMATILMGNKSKSNLIHLETSSMSSESLLQIVT